MAGGARGGRQQAQEEEQICPLCINELDETERAWLPCSCGYQLCLFCYDRLKTEFSNRCPNCRVEYDSDFQAGLRRRQERVAQLQQEAADQREVAAAKAAAAAKHHVQPPPPPPPRAARSPRSPRSPRRDLHIEQEQLWPSLGAAAAAAAPAHHAHQHTAQHQRQQQQQQQQQRPPPPAETAGRRQGSPPQPLSQPRLAPILPAPPPLAEPEASSSSSADTAATTPQSPVSSVVCFRAAQVQPALLGCDASKQLLAAAAAAAALPPAAAVQGRCAVVLQRNGGGLGVEPDPEGASLAASLQEAVRAGSLSVKQAAASLASYLRQRQHAAVMAAAAGAAAGSAGSSPARGGRQLSSAGSSGSTPAGATCGGLTPFSIAAGVLVAATAAGCSGGCGMLSSEPSLLSPCDSSHSVATSASLSHWAPGSASPASSLPLPMAQTLHGLGGGAVWQQQQQHYQQQQYQQQQLVGSPVRDNDKLPLFMRRGSLRPGAALAGSGGSGSGGGGSPSSAGSQGSSSAASGSFPGFPSRSGSPTQELKRIIAPPPGFGPPPGSTGIAALPRFR